MRSRDLTALRLPLPTASPASTRYVLPLPVVSMFGKVLTPNREPIPVSPSTSTTPQFRTTLSLDQSSSLARLQLTWAAKQRLRILGIVSRQGDLGFELLVLRANEEAKYRKTASCQKMRIVKIASEKVPKHAVLNWLR